MYDIKKISGGVCAAKGFKAGGIHCGIRKNRKKSDLALIVSDKKASAAAVYTLNLVKGAPLTVTKANLTDGYAQAVIVNSGNANTCNSNGIEIAEGMCALVEKHTGNLRVGCRRRIDGSDRAEARPCADRGRNGCTHRRAEE